MLDFSQTLVDAIVDNATRDPERTAIVLIEEDGSQQRITAGALHRDALGRAGALAARGIAPDDVVVLAMRHGRDLLAAFLGALYAGAVPTVFPYLTEKLDASIYAERVRTLAAEADARAVITLPELLPALAGPATGDGCRVLDGLAPVDPAAHDAGFRPGRFGAEKLAFLQYTSGTTGLQKGIAVSHRAVLANMAARLAAFPVRPDDVVVSWLPLYHDMGLLTGLLTPLVTRVPSILMSPSYWLRRPVTLLRAIHDFRGTLCWLPNFAFHHCVRSIGDRELAGIDLRHWRGAISGGEPVRPDTIEKFCARFAACGFRRDAFRIGYGLAENVLTASFSRAGAPVPVDWIDRGTMHAERRAAPVTAATPGSTAVVSCGVPLPGTEIAILDDDGTRLPERRIGEITLRSGSLLTGYHRRPELTATLVRDGWLRTGDLGYLADGELYVCGRKKDVIIVGGRNLYPQDFEAIAEGVPGLQPGRAVAFGLPDDRLGTERVVLVCEPRRDASADDLRAVERDLRRRTVQALDIALGEVRIVPRGWVVKTSSGKVARAANRDKYLAEPSRPPMADAS